MVQIHNVDINPPLINSSCAWASDIAQLEELYSSPWTGAVTTRTATFSGFSEDSSHAVGKSFALLLVSPQELLGCVYNGHKIFFEFLRLLPLPPISLSGMDKIHSLQSKPIQPSQTIHNKHNVVFSRRALVHA
jgi:hypothetical protein